MIHKEECGHIMQKAEEKNLPSIKPYFIRAWHEWCSEHGYTPYIVVAVDDNVEVPQEHIHNGQIVLNTSWDATGNLQLGNHVVKFQARFSGCIREIVIPIERIQAIYARENGAGMEFEVEEVKAPSVAFNRLEDSMVSAPVTTKSLLDKPTSTARKEVASDQKTKKVVISSIRVESSTTEEGGVESSHSTPAKNSNLQVVK